MDINYRRIKRKRKKDEERQAAQSQREFDYQFCQQTERYRMLWHLLDQTRSDMFSYVFKEKPTDE